MSGFKFKDVDKGWDRIKKEVQKMKTAHVNIGVLSKAPSYPDGGPNLADVATWMEFGVPSKSIPARPFMAQTFDTNVGGILSYLKRQKDAIMAGQATVDSALNMLGLWYVGKTKETIVGGDFAPNAPRTIKQKGSSRPLVDTRHLSNSINYEVKK